MEQQFGQWLRYYRKKNGMSQKQVARVLKVGQTTIANYENNSRFPDQQKLVALAELFNASLDRMLEVRTSPGSAGGGEGQAAAKPRPDEILRRILEGRELDAWESLESLVVSGTHMAEIYLDILEPLLILTGELWAGGNISVAEEHIISHGVEGFMDRLRTKYPKAPPSDKLCICATVPGESHSIGIRMLRDLLEQAGWRAFFLGDKVPTDQLVSLALSARPHLLAFSATLSENRDSGELLIHRLRREERLARIPIVLGGKAFSEEKRGRKNLPADYIAGSLHEGLRLAEELTQIRVYSP